MGQNLSLRAIKILENPIKSGIPVFYTLSDKKMREKPHEML